MLHMTGSTGLFHQHNHDAQILIPGMEILEWMWYIYLVEKSSRQTYDFSCEPCYNSKY